MIKNLFKKDPSDKVIASIEIVTLHLSGMRGSVDYEIVMKDGQAQVSQYEIRYVDHEDHRILQKQALCETSTLLSLLNDCKLLSWDGFNGPHPKGVLDGTMFTLKATVNEGKKIYAQGSENFPKHYRKLRDGLYNILNAEENSTRPDNK